MINLFITLFLLLPSAFAIEFNKYHTVNDINEYLREVEKKNPEIAQFKILGQSAQKREISYLILSDGDVTRPAVYFNGTHHGNEKSSTEAVLGLIDYFIKNKNKQKVKSILNSYTLYFQPLVNPDGHALDTRGNHQGIDPNRDYSSPEKDEGESFRLPEIKLVKSLVDKVKFRGALAYHSGIEEVLWPWCYTADAPQNSDMFEAISKETASAMGFERYLQSYLDYPTNGEFIDYVYWKYGTVSLTVELSKVKTPPVSELPGIIKKTIDGAIKFLELLKSEEEGTLFVLAR